VFPTFPELADMLAKRAGYLYGIDPDDNIAENPFLSEAFQGIVEDCPTTRTFDLVTMRMVAEHVVDPPRCLARIARMLKPSGRLVIYTPHKWAPMSVVASVMPFALHNPFKRILWNTESRDTFPTQYKMNTRKELLTHCSAVGLIEAHYQRLDDLRITNAYRWLNGMELSLRRLTRAMGVGYPEACILAVYQKPAT
jgi:2-polyprenyl-3-methyl-5-hydroxy-6-metoxy-1,4-benzoquinol methylase